MARDAECDEHNQAVETQPQEEAERQRPGYRFPVLEEATAEFALELPPFPEAPKGFSGSLERLLECLREGTFRLETVPLAPLVDQYLAFRERLAPDEAQERVSDFLPLAATLIHLKSQLFVRQLKAEPPEEQTVREDLVKAIRREERRRREQPRSAGEEPAVEEGPPRLTLLDLMVLLDEVRTSLRAPLEVTEEDLSVRDAMRWIRSSLPENAALQADRYFDECPSRRDQAAVFLAVLELSRHRFLDCHQTGAFAPLWISLAQESDQPLVCAPTEPATA
jgi:segregation and condensation protein A